MAKKILAAKITIVLFVILTLSTFTVLAGGIPVFDGIANTTRIMQVTEAIAQTLKQIEEYKTQLEQYDDMLQNTQQPREFIWDNVRGTMRNLLEAIDTIEYFKREARSLDEYLRKYQYIDHYKNSPCFKEEGCSDDEWEAFWETRRLGSESQKVTNNAVMRGIDQQQKQMKFDATKLIDLQKAAQDAEGRMEAIGYANQLASSQVHQLLQIRGLLIAQQNAIVARNQEKVDKEALEEVSSKNFRKGSFRPSPEQKW